MAIKIIVSYDGTANEADAIALGGLFARAGGEVALAYVRHNEETVSDSEAKELLARGAALFGDPSMPTFFITGPSTPEGLAALATDRGAEVIVFCSDSHTAKGHVGVGNSAQRLIDGGSFGVAIAPAAFAERDQNQPLGTIVAVSDGDGGARETADSLAAALGATVAPVVNDDAGMVVLDSRAEAEPGRVSISSSAGYLIDVARCPVLVLPRSRPLAFGSSPAPAHAA
jgi:nucleotide-binding universal stress UspA family protein